MIEAKVSYEKGEAWIKYDDEKVTVAKLREVINSTGFQAVEEKRTGSGEALMLRGIKDGEYESRSE